MSKKQAKLPPAQHLKESFVLLPIRVREDFRDDLKENKIHVSKVARDALEKALNDVKGRRK